MPTPRSIYQCLRKMIVADCNPRSFGLAGLITIIAIAVRLGMDRILPATPPFITLYPAVILTALFCGPVMGGVSALVGVAAAIYFWIPPRWSFALPNLTAVAASAIFLASSAIVLGATAYLRSQLSQAKRASQALDLGLAAGGVGTWEIDLKTLRIAASPAAYAMHGMPRDRRDSEPQDWLHVVHPDDQAVARAALQQAIQDGGVASYMYRVLIAGHPPRWVRARGQVVNSGAGRRLLCALVDVTDQMTVQDELSRERERLRLALEAGALAVWDFDPASDDAAIDMRYAISMGVDPARPSISRAEIGARIHPDDRARVAAEHDAHVANGTEYKIEYRMITPAGETRWVCSEGIFVRSEPAGLRRMVGIIQDITERKQREQNLAERAAARELLIREADHRIKNSLQLVISLLTVQLRGIDDPAAREALRGAIARVGAIAASHLALQSSEDFTTLDLTVTLQELCAHFSELHPAVTTMCRRTEPLILDADRAVPLGLALSEILTNALRHAFTGRSHGSVTVDAAVQGAELVVQVRDNGIGMAEQAAAPGLGSRIIRALMTQLGASMQVESTREAGTCVTLRLPLQTEIKTASAA